MAGETVLVVDDAEENIKFLKEYILKPNGYKVLTASDGVEGLNIALSQKVDLIISDLVMPRMGGLELLESLQNASSNVPTILTTSYGSEKTAVKAFRLGSKDYVIKPYGVDEMLMAIDKSLAEVRLRQERKSLMQNLMKVNKTLEHQLKEMRTLYAVGRSVTSLLDLDELLLRIVEATTYLSGAEQSSIMLTDENGDLYMRAAKGIKDVKPQSFRIKAHDGISAQVVRTGEPIILGGYDEDDSFKVKTDYFVKALICVPLKFKDEVTGILMVSNLKSTQGFKKRDIELLATLAHYSSIAIENARLHAQIDQQPTQNDVQHDEVKKNVQITSEQISGSQTLSEITTPFATLGHLAAGVAHELINPIKTIHAKTKTVSEQFTNDADLLKHTNEIECEIAKCQRIIKSLLDFAGETHHDKRPVKLDKVLNKAMNQLSKDKKINRQIEIIRGYAPKLKSVMGDQNQFFQAFYYILQHSLDSMSTGGTLRVITRSIGHEAQVIITDTGEGISNNEIYHIFDPFYKSAKHNYGLGLSIAYGVIERYNGTIEVDSKLGSGTTFTIRFPIWEE
ncbi:MAG: hypothetical protein B6242_11320 [Anaerolineaceae bacterium 4572_78]|nr:MAG: hypothetical protein B6242_11320 [Anaerolineaceae bacterium 4572_78]